MARKLRIYYPGAFYHVMMRGNHGQEIFFSDKDRENFLILLQEGILKYHYRIHAYCLMSNHIHLAIQIGEVPLSKIMHNLLFRFARLINRNKQRSGHLFQGRHQAILVDVDAYAVNVVRYIHLNPVKANITIDPAHYRWSSYNAYLGNTTIKWLTTDWLLGLFSQSYEEALKKFAQFMQDRSEIENIVTFCHARSKYAILGTDKFIEKLNIMSSYRQPVITLASLVEIVSAYFQLNADKLLGSSRARIYSKARLIIAILSEELKIATPTNLAEYFNRDASRFSRLIATNRDAYYNDLTSIKGLLVDKSISQA